jgi:hypothetical protein
MPKFANSSMQERIDLMEYSVRLFGCDSIEYILAAMEFIRDKLLEYLNMLHIEYHIRICNKFWIINNENVRELKKLYRSINQTKLRHFISKDCKNSLLFRAMNTSEFNI